MDSLLEKFYNGGSLQSRNGFTRFSAFHPNSSMNVGLAPATKSPLPVRPLISTVNSTNININHKPNLTINTNYNNLVTNNNLAFNSSSDLLYNNPGYTHKRYNSEYNIRNNTVADIKRNDTKMQMMEEKMKNLELKSQRLEVINDFFFDMFENNLVKEEINKQRENAAKIQKQKYKEEGYEVSSSSESESETDSVSQNNKKTKKNKKKKKQKNLNLNTYDINNMKKKEKFDPIKYQKNKLEYNKDVLEKIRKNVADYLFEEELKKNEQIQIMGEHINELKSKLISKLDKMEMNQQHQIEKIMFCLINSGEADNIPTNFLNSRINSPHGTRRQSIRRRASMSNYQVPNRAIILKHVGGENEQKNNK